MTAWAFQAADTALEVTGTSLPKASNGFAKWHLGVLAILCYSACSLVLAPAMKVLSVGVVYAIWAGVGILAAAVIGVIAFDERLAMVQYLCIALVLVGAVGLRLTTTG